MINIYMHRQCNIDVIVFWKNILRIMIGWIPALLVGVFINCAFDLTNIYVFAAGVIIYSLVYCMSMWLISMNGKEKDIVKSILHVFKKERI